MADLVPEFSPRSVLGILHDSFRYIGGNEFQLPAPADDITNVDVSSVGDFINSPEGSYYVGLLSASISLLVVLLLWLIALPCACCCIKNCNNTCKTIFMFIGLGLSAMGWFISLRGNTFLQDGVTGFIDTIGNVSSDLEATSGDLQDILDTQPQIQATIDGLQQNTPDGCSGLSVEIDQKIDELDATALEALLEPQGAIDDATITVDDALETIQPFLDRISGAYSIIVGFIIFFLFLFALTTLFAVLFRRDVLDQSRGCFITINNVINTAGCCIFFSIGLLFVILVIIFCIIVSPIVLGGSDLCVPGIDTIALDLLVPASESNVQNGLDFCNLVAVGEEDLIDLAGNAICHYSTCTGNNLALDRFGVNLGGDNIDISEIDNIQTQLDEARDLIDALGIDTADCEGFVDDLESQVLSIQENIDSALTRATCNEVTPLLRSAIDDNTCNGIIAGFGVIFISWTAGAIGMMVGMFAYAMIDFSPTEKFDILEEPREQTADVQVTATVATTVQEVRYDPVPVGKVVDVEDNNKSPPEVQQEKKESVDPIF